MVLSLLQSVASRLKPIRSHVMPLVEHQMLTALLAILLVVGSTFWLSVSLPQPRSKKEGPCIILCWCLGAVAAAVISVLGFRAFFQMDYVKGGPFNLPGYTRSQAVGLTMWLYFCPIAVILGLMAMHAIQTNLHTHTAVKTAFALVLLSCSIGTAISGTYLARQNVTGSYVSVGLAVLVVSLTFGIAFCVVLVSNSWFHSFGTRDRHVRQVEHPGTSKSLLVQARRRQIWQCLAGMCLAVVVLPVLWLFTTLLPNSFTNFTTSQIVAGMAAVDTTAERSDAWMTTKNVKLSEAVVLKIFPDTIIFYGFLEILAVAAVCAKAFPTFGRWLAKRTPEGFSVGEVSAMCLFVIMLALWIFYWLHDHSYHAGKETIDPVWWERVARTWGQTAVLFMSLLLLPASKNSLWLQALGISWEQGLWVHRWLGYGAIIFMLCHILSFWARFAQLGSFPYDACALILYYAINGPMGQEPNYDNFTIAVNQLVAYPALLMIGIPVLLRGKHWELFKYFHFVFLPLVPAVLLHAASSWYFMLGGIAFWLIDACMRFVCVVAPPARLLEQGIEVYQADGGITELRMDWSHSQPAQFAWLRVPAISLWEWHPFSLASAPHDGVARMCIKSMGPGTFTDRLYSLAATAKETGTTFDIQVDGPYGPALDVGQHAAMMLIAGGIGITQIHSTFRALSYLAGRGELPSTLQAVKLVWISRSTDLFKVFDTSIQECLEPLKLAGREQGAPSSQLPTFSAVFYHTDPAGRDSASATATSAASARLGVETKQGRPSFQDLYSQVDDLVLKAGGTLSVEACGPEAMVQAAAKAAADRPRLFFQSALYRF